MGLANSQVKTSRVGSRETTRGAVVRMIKRLLAGTQIQDLSGNCRYKFEENAIFYDGKSIPVYTGPDSNYDMNKERAIYISICPKTVSGEDLDNMELALNNLVGDYGKTTFEERCNEIYDVLHRQKEDVRLIIFDIKRECVKKIKRKGKIWQGTKVNMVTGINNLEALKATKEIFILYDSEDNKSQCKQLSKTSFRGLEKENMDKKDEKIIYETVTKCNEVKNTGKKSKKYDEKNKSCMKNRELSWLDFNERVLNEAGNPRVPLAERLTFASIFQSNLDEFYMVRVGTLMVQMHSKEIIRENKTDMTSEEQVKAILKRTAKLEEKKAKIYEQLMGELEPKKIRIINFNKLSVQEGKLLESYFDAHVAPFLFPMLVSRQQPFPFLDNKALYAVVMLNTKGKKKKMGIVPCTNSVFQRLIEIPTRPGTFMLSEELILHFVSKMFPKYEIAEKSLMRITRNADIDMTDVYDEDLDYRDLMERLIKRRRKLSPVRLELSRKLSKKTVEELCDYLGLNTNHVFMQGIPLDLKFVFQLQGYLRDEKGLFYEKRTPRPSPALDIKKNICEQIRRKDVLLSYPFESIKPFITMLNQAAEDEDVVSIKMTLYRVADRSKIVEALIEAAENGKEVVVLVELRARFDEENNIEMSRKLEDAGCHVIYGLGDYKVHSKLCLITRKNREGFDYITQIGTGNYNEKTAELYTDLSLMTANPDIGMEADKVFKMLLLGDTVDRVNHLLVAPNCLQSKVVEMIDTEIAHARAGQSAYIGLKLNSLTDKVIIEKLIEASCAGVKVDMIVRGICCLKAQVPGLTDNITVVSVVGRYLEHSRIYRFGCGDEEKIYISSADFMTRNTVRRVEVATPIYDEDIRNRIKHIFDTIMLDDEKGKEQNSKGEYVDREINEVKLNSQEEFYKEAYDVMG